MVVHVMQMAATATHAHVHHATRELIVKRSQMLVPITHARMVELATAMVATVTHVRVQVVTLEPIASLSTHVQIISA